MRRCPGTRLIFPIATVHGYRWSDVTLVRLKHLVGKTVTKGSACRMQQEVGCFRLIVVSDEMVLLLRLILST
ncbi:hypothetical protein IAQ61_005973 [Plenodomus lingam]|uniref:uncharacterized protein n=1 Tax=Leptosphaeria maculans TaxID=5022 RepID=UPI003322B6AC|nr:hypothetical protein IAQ61_005973 [Plenodomus lingam]